MANNDEVESNTIVAEAATKIRLTSVSPENIARWAEQLVDVFVRTGKSHNAEQIKLMMS